MAKMNHYKQNKFKNGSLDRRDELKSAGERWLEKHDRKADPLRLPETRRNRVGGRTNADKVPPLPGVSDPDSHP
jgi:hypothetical protein